MHVCAHTFMYMHKGIYTHVCVMWGTKTQKGSTGLAEGGRQRSDIFASQGNMKFQEKTMALGDAVNLTCIQ